MNQGIQIFNFGNVISLEVELSQGSEMLDPVNFGDFIIV